MSLDSFRDHFISAFPDLIGKTVVVALSGGADSVALLHLLCGAHAGVRVEAAHVHHGVRGDEADGDAEFCAQLAAEVGIPFHALRIRMPRSAPSGREATWRQLRYQALFQLASERGAAAVATAHHRDDIAEGVLVQLLRGAGPRALAGIAPRTGAGIIRPLLPWTRNDLRCWLRQNGRSWREDSSNRSTEHLRNRVRHELLPRLEAASPSIRSHLVELAGSLAAGEDHFSAELTALDLWIDPWHPDGGVGRSCIVGLSKALRVRWLHAQASRVGIGRVTRPQLELFMAMLSEGSPRAVTLERRWVMRLAGQRLWLEPPGHIGDYALQLEPGETTALPIPGWKIRVGVADGDDRRWRHVAEAGRRLTVRSPRSDDRLGSGPGATTAAKALSRRLPRHLRRAWPVFCEDDRICWIPGVWQHPAVTRSRGHVVEVTRRE